MQDEEELDPRAAVLDEIGQWAKLGEADEMRARHGKPPRLLEGEEAPELEEAIPGVEPAEPPEGGGEGLGEELDIEKLKAVLAALGG
jgi:hypothetical protein